MTDPTQPDAPQGEQTPPTAPPPSYPQQPYGQQPPYGQPSFPPPGYAAPPPGYPAPGYNPYAPTGYLPPFNALAIVAFILAFTVSVGGIVAGHIALSQIRRTGERGHALALWGTILGYVFTAGYIALGVVWAIVFLALAAHDGYYWSSIPAS